MAPRVTELLLEGLNQPFGQVVAVTLEKIGDGHGIALA